MGITTIIDIKLETSGIKHDELETLITAQCAAMNRILCYKRNESFHIWYIKMATHVQMKSLYINIDLFTLLGKIIADSLKKINFSV